MAYKKVGLVAVMDIANFMPNVAKFVGSIQQINQTLANTAAGTGAAQKPLIAMGTILGGIALTAATIVGSNVIAEIGNQISKISKQALDAAANFQLLEKRFETLAARDYMRTTGESLEASLQATSGAAAAQMEWLREMAILTPYTVESLASLSAYAQAAGFTQTEVKRLSQTIGDFSAGMGLLPEHVSRSNWNFSQMMSAGRVLGRELRDLSTSMVPVDYIIEKLAGEFDTTKEKIKEMLQVGTIDARKFIETFNQMSEEEFAEAMERLSRTFVFAKNNLKDFIDTMLGLDILKPTLDELGGLMADLLKDLLSEPARRATAGFGFALRNAFLFVKDTIVKEVVPSIQEMMRYLGISAPTVEGLTRAIMNLGFALAYSLRFISRVGAEIGKFVGAIRDTLSPGFRDLERDGYSWGANLIVQFARGMAFAVGAIIKALTFIAGVVTEILKPGSPPKLLPDIDAWGTGTMNAWLQGFKLADFSIFNDISSMIERYLKAMDIEKTDVLVRVLGSRDETAEALSAFSNSTTLAASAIRGITDAAGISTGVMRNYISAIFKASKVADQAKEALSILDYSLERSAIVQGQIVNTLDKAREAAQAYQGVGASAVRSYITALEKLRKAQEKAKISQVDVNSVVEYYDAILLRLREQQNALTTDLENANRIRQIDRALRMKILTTEERERLELEKRGILLAREIRDTQLARDKAVQAADEKNTAAQEALKLAQDNASIQKQIAQDIINSTKAQAEAQAEYYEDLLSLMISTMEKAKELATETAKSAKSEMEDALAFAPIEVPDLDYTSITEGVEEAVNLMFEDLKLKWDDLWAEVTSPFTDLEDDLIELRIHLTALHILLDEKIKPALQWIEEHAVGITQAFLGVMLFLKIAQLVPLILPIVAAIGNFIKSIMVGIMFGASFSKIIAGIGAAIAGITVPIWALVAALAVLIAVFFIFGKDAWESFKMLAFIVGYYMSQALDWLIEAPKKAWQALKDWWSILLIISVTGARNIALWLIAKGAELIQGISKWSEDVLDDIADFVGRIKDAITGSKGAKLIADFLKFGKNIIAGVIDGITEQATKLYAAITNVIKTALGKAEKESETASPSKKFMKLGRGWMLGLQAGILGNAYLVDSAISATMAKAMAQPMLGGYYGSQPSAAMSTPQNIYNNQTINMSMSPQYQNVQSPSSVYYDVAAALAAIRR